MPHEGGAVLRIPLSRGVRIDHVGLVRDLEAVLGKAFPYVAEFTAEDERREGDEEEAEDEDGDGDESPEEGAGCYLAIADCRYC